MDDQRHERTGVTRVKELEEIVKKLEQENKQLLDKVGSYPIYKFYTNYIY